MVSVSNHCSDKPQNCWWKTAITGNTYILNPTSLSLLKYYYVSENSFEAL